MNMLRILGICVGLTGVVLVSYARFRLGQLRRGEWVLGVTLGLGLVWIGLFPDFLDRPLSLLSFQTGGGERLIGLLILSNLLLYYLLFIGAARHTRLEQCVDDLIRELAKSQFRQSHTPDHAPVYVIIPAYNEAENIGGVLERMPATVCGLRTCPLVVVDGATDDTAAVAQRLNVSAVVYPTNRGGGSALKTGYELAVERGAEIVVTLDADGQHDPQEIPNLVRPILEGEADVVNGSRVLGTHHSESAVRAAGIVFFNFLVSVLLVRRITDCSNGFRAIRANSLAKLDLQQMQFHAAELIIEAVKKGLRVREVPVTVHVRANGMSKKGGTIGYASRFMRAILATWLR